MAPAYTFPTDEHPVAAKVIADSITEEGHRLISVQETFWRPVLAERNTHRIQAKNSASSRARSVHKVLADLHDRLAMPLSWPAEQKGMQGGEELTGRKRVTAETAWRIHAEHAINTAERLVELGLHKSVVNRLLEPYSMHTAIVTATGWGNYLDQRAHEDAQPEIRAVAELTKEAIERSEPVLLVKDEWHLPYVDKRVREDVSKRGLDIWGEKRALTMISAARCARTSYLTQDGEHDIDADLGLFDRLVTERLEQKKPIHWSPLEHVATPDRHNVQDDPYSFVDSLGITHFMPTRHLPRVGPFPGWRTMRTEIEASNKMLTYR